MLVFTFHKAGGGGCWLLVCGVTTWAGLIDPQCFGVTGLVRGFVQIAPVSLWALWLRVRFFFVFFCDITDLALLD